MRELLYSPKQNKAFLPLSAAPDGLVSQFVRYGLVGGAAFAADASVLYLLHRLGLHYLAAGALAFSAGLFVNFLLAKRFVFTRASGRAGRAGEFLVYGLIGLAGLALTELLLYVFTGVLGFCLMLSKAAAAALVLVWSFAARRLILYR